MSKKFPDLKSDEEAEDWLQSADLTDYDLSDMKKVRFELAPKDSSISLRLPAALLSTLRGRAESRFGSGPGSGGRFANPSLPSTPDIAM